MLIVSAAYLLLYILIFDLSGVFYFFFPYIALLFIILAFISVSLPSLLVKILKTAHSHKSIILNSILHMYLLTFSQFSLLQVFLHFTLTHFSSFLTISSSISIIDLNVPLIIFLGTYFSVKLNNVGGSASPLSNDFVNLKFFSLPFRCFNIYCHYFRCHVDKSY